MKPEQIKELRRVLGMSQQEFADLLGLSDRSAVCRIESGEREPTGPLAKLLDRIAAEAGMTAGR